MEKLLEEEHLSQYSCRTPHWTPGSSCRPAGTGTRQRHMRLFLQQGPGQVGCRGSLMREAPSWMLCVEPAVTLIRSSARGTDPYQELSSGWGLSGGEITSAVEPQPQHLKMGTKDSIPVSLLPFPPPALSCAHSYCWKA